MSNGSLSDKPKAVFQNRNPVGSYEPQGQALGSEPDLLPWEDVYLSASWFEALISVEVYHV